jgi:hypothetical protein
MPTVFKKDGFRFYFYSEEGNEPMHVHVAYGDGRAKYWLKPDVILASSIGFKAKDIKKAKQLIQSNLKLVEEKWNEFDVRRKNP